tara:strand:- start:19246 stop:19860 length:615 start_codon:yes stop_codon:yes gene_type:complete
MSKNDFPFGNENGGNFIFLGNRTKDSLLDNVSAESKYIITMNDYLQNEDRMLRETNNNLKKELESLEDEQDNLERRCTYIKSLVKNFHEMYKLKQQIASNYDSMFKELSKILNNYKNNSVKYYRYSYVSFMFYVIIFYCISRNIIETIIMFSINTIYFLYFYENINKLKIPDFKHYSSKIKEYETEIKKTEASQDYIHEFIDSI